MKGTISVPEIGIKSRSTRRFKVYNVDEFRISCINHKTEKRCENLWLFDKEGVMRKIYSILTYKMENNSVRIYKELFVKI